MAYTQTVNKLITVFGAPLPQQLCAAAQVACQAVKMLVTNYFTTKKNFPHKSAQHQHSSQAYSTQASTEEHQQTAKQLDGS
jgi:hypothetical protein